jgi:hypothetical protein
MWSFDLTINTQNTITKTNNRNEKNESEGVK